VAAEKESKKTEKESNEIVGKKNLQHQFSEDGDVQ
jgi:hypothetical protein